VKPGPKPRPALAVVREGNPRKRPVNPGVTLPPAALVEPDWSVVFPASSSRDPWSVLADVPQAPVEVARLREVAAAEWGRVVPMLSRSAGLADVDVTVLRDYCVCVARIDQCERGLSDQGLVYQSERGWVKNGLTTIVGQYRQQLRTYIGELGLSPSARARLSPAGGDDGDDVFD